MQTPIMNANYVQQNALLVWIPQRVRLAIPQVVVAILIYIMTSAMLSVQMELMQLLHCNVWLATLIVKHALAHPLTALHVINQVLTHSFKIINVFLSVQQEL